MRFGKITISGVGLLGGSLGLVLKQRQLAGHVEGFVRRAASVRECRRLGVVDSATLNLAAAVADADLVVLCTPIARMESLVYEMLPHLKRGVVVTDVGSVKSSVVQTLEPILRRAGGSFVGSHPMAGSEKMGPSAARADLFAGAVCVVTPTPQSNPAAVRKVEFLWKAVGARVMKMAPELHDTLVSRSSHLPHCLAATLVNHVLGRAHPKAQSGLCASGFRDTTRIASGSPEMWRDIALANRRHLGQELQAFARRLQSLSRAMERGDARFIETFFQGAKELRDRWQERATSSSTE